MCHDEFPREAADQGTNKLGACPARYNSSPFQEAHKAAALAQQQHEKATMAIEFFNKHPEFDAFVSLVRSGVISF